MEKKRKISILLTLIILLTTVIPSYAEVVGQLGNEKNEIVTEMEKLEEKEDIDKSEEVDENTEGKKDDDKEEQADVDEGKKEISIKSYLSNNIGENAELPPMHNKEYITAAFEDEIGIKSVLDFGNKFPVNVETNGFKYELEKIMIGNLLVTKEHYNGNTKLKELGISDYAIFNGVDEIKVYYTGLEKAREKRIKVDIEGIDSYHETINYPDTLKKYIDFVIPYTGTEPNITVKLIKDGNKFYIQESINNEKKEINFTGYTIKSVSKESNGEYKFTANLEPEEVKIHTDSSGKEFYKLGPIHFYNVHNGGIESRDLIRERQADKFYLVEKDGLLDTREDLLNLLNSEVTNRKNSVNTKKYYKNDVLVMLVKDEERNTFIQKALGEGYMFDGSNFIKMEQDDASQPTNHNIEGFDNLRLEYKVKVNDGDIQTFDVVKGDTRYLIFDNDNIQSVKVNGQDKKGQEIDLEALGSEVITIVTKDGQDIPKVNYSVQNRIFELESSLHKKREFEGLKGTKLKVNVIRQNRYKKGDKIEIEDNGQIYKLSDSEEKEIILSENLETPFYFTTKNQVRYKVLYITKYGENWDIDGDYKIDTISKGKEGASTDTVRVLHESNTFVDKMGNPISVRPKNFDEGNFELIKLDKPIDSIYELDDYKGFKVKYISDGVDEVPNGDTIFVYSYRQLVDKNTNEVRIPFRETFEDSGEQFQETFELVYPRYAEDYRVELEIGIRHTCYSERVANIIGQIDGLLDLKFNIDGPKKGFLEFTIKGTGDTSGDLFPKEKKGKKMGINIMKKPIDDSFKGIEINYRKLTGDTCGPESELVVFTLNIINAFKDENGKPVKISGDWNERTCKTLKNTKIRLGSLRLEGGKLVFKKEITRDSNQKSYSYTPTKNNSFQGICDIDGKTIEVDLNKVLGKDIDEFLVGYKGLDKIYFIFEEKKSPEYEKDINKFRLSYYKIELKDKISQNNEELMSKFGLLLDRKDLALNKHYENIKKDINDYYKSENREKIVNEVTNLIDMYYKSNALLKDGSPNPEIINDLKEFRSKLDKNNVLALKEKPIALIDSLISKHDSASHQLPVDGKGDKYVVLNKIDLLFMSLPIYLEREGYSIRSVGYNEFTGEEAKAIVRWYDKDRVPKAKGPERQAKIPGSIYKVDRYTQYGWLPISISGNINENNELFKGFMTISDYNDGFNLGIRASWDSNPDKKVIVNGNEEINNDIPIIFLERQFDIYDLDDEKPEPDKETKRNLNIVYRFYDKNGTLIEERAPIKYENLQEYINKLGWKINNFKSAGYTYIDTEKKGLKEGDIKYSDKLENKKTVTMYLDYKGEGKTPPIDDDKYGYKIFHKLVDLSNPNGEPGILGVYPSNTKYPVGTGLEISPMNREAEGYALIDNNNQFIDKYLPKKIEIKDEKVYGNTVNYHYYRYAKIKDIKNAYKVQYVNENYDELASSEVRRLDLNQVTKEEVAKTITNYKARIGKTSLEIGKKANVDKLIHFKAENGYTVKLEDGKYLLYQGDIKCAEILLNNGENILRIIYDFQDSNIKNNYRVQYVDSDYRELATSELRSLSVSEIKREEVAKTISRYRPRINKINLEVGKKIDNDKIIHFIVNGNYTVRLDGNKYALYQNNLRVAEILKDKEENILRFIYDRYSDPIRDDEYIVEYVDSNYKELATSEKRRIKASDDELRETAKSIRDYEERIGRIDLKVGSTLDSDAIVHFVDSRNYTIKLEGRRYVLYKDRLRCAEILEKDGETILRIIYDRKRTTDPDRDKDRDKGRDRTTTRIPEEKLDRVNHKEYIQGYPDNTVRPTNNITREEVAAVFYRLLNDNYKSKIYTLKHNFKDVNSDRWSLKHIGTLSNGKVLTGYEDGSFKPGANITRAEVAAIASRFDALAESKHNFIDVKGHWAEDYIGSAVKKGWIKGYPDGSFKPDQYITRSEFVTLVNAVLDRKVRQEGILIGVREFKDLEKDKWYYLDFVEAINGHIYSKNAVYERWIQLKKFEYDM